MKENNHFFLEKNRLVCWRLGNGNSVKQRHFNKMITINTLGGEHKPPVSRGVWAFPYPFYDYFFAYHQWVSKLPKEYREFTGNENLKEAWWNERELKLNEIQKKFRPIKFLADSFYSHISEHGKSNYSEWYYWDSPKDWINVAKKHLITWERGSDKLYKIDYTKDHLEIFVVI